MNAINIIFCSTLATIFFPLKDLNYFQTIYKLIRSIYIVKDAVVIKNIKITKIILILQAVHLIYFSNPNLSDYERTVKTVLKSLLTVLTNVFFVFQVFFDGFYVLIPNSQFNTVAFLCLVLEYYTIGVLQNKLNYSLINFLHKILIDKNTSFFLFPKEVDKKSLCNKLQKCYYFVMNIFQSFLFVDSK